MQMGSPNITAGRGGGGGAWRGGGRRGVEGWEGGGLTFDGGRPIFHSAR